MGCREAGVGLSMVVAAVLPSHLRCLITFVEEIRILMVGVGYNGLVIIMPEWLWPMNSPSRVVIAILHIHDDSLKTISKIAVFEI